MENRRHRRRRRRHCVPKGRDSVSLVLLSTCACKEVSSPASSRSRPFHRERSPDLHMKHEYANYTIPSQPLVSFPHCSLLQEFSRCICPCFSISFSPFSLALSPARSSHDSPCHWFHCLRQREVSSPMPAVGGGSDGDSGGGADSGHNAAARTTRVAHTNPVARTLSAQPLVLLFSCNANPVEKRLNADPFCSLLLPPLLVHSRLFSSFFPLSFNDQPFK